MSNGKVKADEFTSWRSAGERQGFIEMMLLVKEDLGVECLVAKPTAVVGRARGIWRRAPPRIEWAVAPVMRAYPTPAALARRPTARSAMTRPRAGMYLGGPIPGSMVPRSGS